MPYYDKKTQVDVDILDFSKAIDVVPHVCLLNKIQHYDITGDTHPWIRMFLTQRNQSVLVDGSHSSKVQVDSGVPQRTVIGPLLFLLYINNLPDCVSSQVRPFADDHDCLLYRPITPLPQMQLQDDLKAPALRHIYTLLQPTVADHDTSSTVGVADSIPLATPVCWKNVIPWHLPKTKKAKIHLTKHLENTWWHTETKFELYISLVVLSIWTLYSFLPLYICRWCNSLIILNKGKLYRNNNLGKRGVFSILKELDHIWDWILDGLPEDSAITGLHPNKNHLAKAMLEVVVVEKVA